MNTYVYEGPVYDRDGRRVESKKVEYTTAKTDKEAFKNIQYKIGKDKQIIPANIRRIVTDYMEIKPSLFCKDCGNLLNDAGRCPLCQDFEYSILDDIKLLADIDDVE